MADRVDLHVGLPKTGTSSIQRTLFARRSALEAAGVSLVVSDLPALFAASRDLVHGGSGDWATLAAAVRDTPGRVLLSCEGLSAVPPTAVADGVAALGAAEVRLVVTLRDPARVLPSVWQQVVRTGGTIDLPDFLATVRDGMRWEWLHDPLEVLDAWVPAVQTGFVRLVTVPPSGADPGLLWRRFAEACELSASGESGGAARDAAGGGADGAESPAVANASLSMAAIELVRRTNIALGARRPAQLPRYRALTRPLARALADAAPGSGTALPPADHAWAAATANATVTELRRRGYEVYGDLDELRPVPPSGADSTAAHRTVDARCDDPAGAAAEAAGDAEGAGEPTDKPAPEERGVQAPEVHAPEVLAPTGGERAAHDPAAYVIAELLLALQTADQQSPERRGAGVRRGGGRRGDGPRPRRRRDGGLD